jgi:hypothetical protein
MFFVPNGLTVLTRDQAALFRASRFYLQGTVDPRRRAVIERILSKNPGKHGASVSNSCVFVTPP